MSSEDNVVVKFGEDMIKSAADIKSAFSSISIIYDTYKPGELEKIHIDVIKHAYVYYKAIFPFARSVVKKIKNTMESYVDTEDSEKGYGEFKEAVDFIRANAASQNKMVKFTLYLHETIRSSFMTDEDYYNKDTGASDLVKQIDTDIKNTVKSFLQALGPAAHFFAELETDLDGLSEIEPIKIHFKKYKNKADKVSKGCVSYIKSTSDCASVLLKVNFNELNIYDYHVFEWLSLKRVKFDKRIKEDINVGSKDFMIDSVEYSQNTLVFDLIK